MMIPKNTNKGAKSLTDFVLFLREHGGGSKITKLSELTNDVGFITLDDVDDGTDFVTVFENALEGTESDG